MTRSEYFLFLCAAFISGIMIGSYFDAELWVLLFFLGMAAMTFFAFRRGTAAKISLIIIVAAGGFFRIEVQKRDDIAVAKYDAILSGPKMTIDGRIIQTVKTKNGSRQIVIDDIRDQADGKIIPGKLIAYVGMYPEFEACSDIRMEGKVEIPDNFNGFDYKKYLASKGIYHVMYYPEVISEKDNGDKICNLSDDVRRSIYSLNKKIYPEPQSGIMNALLLGIESDISEEVIEAFNATGTRHFLAISGFNISIIAIIMMHLLLSLGIKRDNAFYFASVGIVFYILIIQSSSSSIRAGIMGELALIACKLGRLPSATNAIFFAASMMLLDNPYLLRFDVGFQLSFLAVMGLMFIYPKFEKPLSGIKDVLGMKTIFMGTMAAQIATFPILLYNFGNVSVLSIISNMLILPFAVPVMIGGFGIIFIGELSMFFGRVLSWPIWLMVQYQIEVIKYISRFDSFSVSFESLNSFFVIGYYLILAFIIWKSIFLTKITSVLIGNEKISNS